MFGTAAVTDIFCACARVFAVAHRAVEVAKFSCAATLPLESQATMHQR